MTVLLREPTPAWLRLAVHLVASPDGTMTGTFVATGLVADSGTLPALARFAPVREDVRLPVVVHGAESLGGTEGAIAIDYDGVFRPAASRLYAGRGAWRVTGGDHAYAGLEAGGAWVATAILGDVLVVDAVYEGYGDLC